MSNDLPPHDPYAFGANEAHAERRAITGERATTPDADVIAAAIIRAATIIARAIGSASAGNY